MGSWAWISLGYMHSSVIEGGGFVGMDHLEEFQSASLLATQMGIQYAEFKLVYALCGVVFFDTDMQMSIFIGLSTNKY